MKTLLNSIAFALSALIAVPAGAQVVKNASELQTGQVYRFELIDGSNRSGVLDSVDGEFVYITNLVSGPDKFYRKAVSRARIQIIGKNGQFASPHYSRYVFGPSAIPQRKKELYWNNLWLEANTFQYGFTDNFSAGMGFGLFSTLAGYPLLMPNFKYGISLDEKNHVAVGTIGLITTDLFQYNTGGALPFAVYTRGDEESQFSLGMGWLYDDGLFMYDDGLSNDVNGWSKYPTLYAAGSHRVSRGWLLGGEFYALSYRDDYYDWLTGTRISVSETTAIAMFYGRNIRPSSSWDFAICTVISPYGDVVPFPLFGYTQRF